MYIYNKIRRKPRHDRVVRDECVITGLLIYPSMERMQLYI